MDRLRQRVRVSVITLDIYCAAMWLFVSSDRWTGPSYAAAREAYAWLPTDLQLRVNGLALIVLTVAIIFATRRRIGLLYEVAAALIVGLWSWWAALFAWAALTDPHAGVLAPGFAALAAVLHLILAATPRA